VSGRQLSEPLAGEENHESPCRGAHDAHEEQWQVPEDPRLIRLSDSRDDGVNRVDGYQGEAGSERKNAEDDAGYRNCST